MSSQTLYDVLGVVPSAGLSQIEKAYRRALDLYSEGSLATYTLLDQGEQESLRQRVQHAYDVLRDPAKRSRYDEELRTGRSPAPESAPARTPAPAPAGGPPAPAPRAVYMPPARPGA
jgi:curved DNA-binding protein CbpA